MAATANPGGAHHAVGLSVHLTICRMTQKTLHNDFPMALKPGTRLKNFGIQAQIGAGGMGEVYWARDLKTYAYDYDQMTSQLHRVEGGR